MAHGEENEQRSAKRIVLLAYMKSQIPQEDAETSARLPEILKSWHFAVQSNVENLISSITTVLALCLKSVSSFLEFRHLGNRLCHILLHDDQIKLLDKGFNVSKAKEYVISPTLKLLTEIVLFDGGQAAKLVYRQRDVTFKRLEIFLTMRKDPQEEATGSRKRPSIRNLAVKYLCANIRLQNGVAKSYILGQPKLVRAWLQDVIEDSPGVVLEILDTLQADIIKDPSLHPSTKSRLFNEWTLGRLATLYGYREHSQLVKDTKDVESVAHELLLLVCTSPVYGVLQARSHSDDRVQLDREDDTEPSMFAETSNSRRQAWLNATLVSFLRNLRPHASVLQSDLIIAVFRAAPELIAVYFDRSNSFSFEPKLTTTWVGYSRFLLATIQLPIPDSLLFVNGHNDILATCSDLVEHILPRPLTQGIMTRCLHQSSSLVTFLAATILAAVFKKLALLLQHIRQSHEEKHELSFIRLEQSTSELTNKICQRCPEMKHVIAQFRSCSRGNTILRQILARLLALYYKVAPQIALEEKFDVSLALASTLNEINSMTVPSNDSGMRSLELYHLLQIARHSPNMEWWHRSGTCARDNSVKIVFADNLR